MRGPEEVSFRVRRNSNKSEFDAAADGVDAVGADFDFVAVLPDLLVGASVWFGASLLAAAFAHAAIVTAAARHGRYGMILFAVHGAGAGECFYRVDGDEAFDKDLE